MRHFWSFLAGLVAAPLAWALISLGQEGSVTTITRWADAGTYNVANLLEPAVYLAVAGILLGLIGTLRFSPFGPLVAGLLLASPYVAMFVKPFGVRNRVPADWEIFGDPLSLRQPLENGTLFMIGLLLLMAMFSVQRWRRWPVDDEASMSDGGSGAGGGSGADAEKNSADRTIDWSVLRDPPGDQKRDTAAPTLGYPEPKEAAPATDRRDGATPWSAPPATEPRGDKAAR